MALSFPRHHGLTPLGPALGTGHFTFAENRYAIGDDVLWTHGAHSIRMGFAGDRLLNNSWNPINEDVVWTFTSFANFLAGQASLESGVVPAPANTAHRDYFQYDFNPYIQDDWKVTPKLTVNLGLRWEFYSNPTERHDNLFAITDFATATGYTRIPNVFQSNPSLKNWDPRIGLAYDPFSDHKTSIRAGFGMFHDPISVQSYQTGFGGAPPWRASTIAGTANPATNPAIYPFPPTLANAPIPSQTVPWYYPINTTPYMIQYNLNVQREVMTNTVLTVGYVGSHGIHLLTGIESNPPTPTIDSSGVYHFSNAAGVQNPRENPAPGLLPDPAADQHVAIQRIASLLESEDSRRNVQAQVSYTWSRCMDDGAFGVTSFDGTSYRHHAGKFENPFNQTIDHAACGSRYSSGAAHQRFMGAAVQGQPAGIGLATQRHSQRVRRHSVERERRLRSRRYSRRATRHARTTRRTIPLLP